MVVIRLQRKGKPHQPYYRVVAIEKARGATGKPIEVLGSYNPRVEIAGKKVEVNKDRYEYWIKVGAQPSDTVATLVKAAFKSAAAK
ncbi:MAG: 30S ribosomal protein S16 [Elusimicrobiota bacterium]|nr:MAG: 30S ribosomal protein S16 [Elusimicrobiota bacterium]